MAISGIGNNGSNIWDARETQINEAAKRAKTNGAASAKEKELEAFLKKIPELERQGYEQLSAQNRALGGTVTFYQQSWTINKDGSVQSTVYSVTETEMTHAERMKKNMDERLERQKEKKEEAKKVQERRDEKAEQAQKPDRVTQKISVPEDVYYFKFDMSV